MRTRIITVIIALMIITVCGILWIWYHPESILIPLNLLYNIDSSPRVKFYTDEQKNIIFPASKDLETVWQDIKQEGYILYESLSNKDINYLNNYHLNLGDETKKEWTTIVLRLFGKNLEINLEKCPVIVRILTAHPEIKSCIFSIMAPGKIIQPHIGPYDGILRYQLALDIPEGNCYLHVGGEKYYWTEGHGILFDDTNLHGAVNETLRRRMVLLVDIERPYSFPPYRILNKSILWCLGTLPLLALK